MRVAIGAWPWPSERAWKRLDIPEFSASCNNALVGSCKYHIEHHRLASDKSFIFCYPLLTTFSKDSKKQKPANRQTSRREDNEVRNTWKFTQSINGICILISRTESVQYSQFSSLTKFTRKKVFRHITNVSFKVSIDLGKFQRISLHDVSSLHDKAKSTTNLLGRDGQNKVTKGKDCSEGRKGVKAK